MGVTYINPYRFGFNPLSLSPALWLDASDTSTITSSGSPAKVSQWNDKSGNVNNATQSTAAAQPSTGTVTVNGLNALSFDGGDWLLTSSFTTSQARTTYFVVVANSHDATRRALGESANANNNDNAWSWMSLEIFTSNRLRASVTAGGIVTTDSANNFPTLQASIAARNILAGPSGYQRVYVDGVLAGSSVLTAAISGATPTNLKIGTYREATSRFWKGSICEIIDYTADHTTAERNSVERYLADKWGITI